MQNYDVRRTFGVWVRGETVELDPDSDDTAALERDGYIEVAAGAK